MLGARAKAKRGGRERARCTLFCTFLHTQPGAQGSSRPYPLVRRAGPATAARGEGCGDAASGRAPGAGSHHLFFPKRLRAWAEGAGEGAWGGGEEEQHLLLVHASETPLQPRPRRTARPACARATSPPSAALRVPKGFAKARRRGAAQLLQPAPCAAEAAEADRGARDCSPARPSLGAATMVCHPRRAAAAAAPRPSRAPPQAAAQAPPQFLSINPPGTPGETEDLRPLRLIGPTALQPRPLTRNEVARETGARVPMTTGAWGLAFRVLQACPALRLTATQQRSCPGGVDS